MQRPPEHAAHRIGADLADDRPRSLPEPVRRVVDAVAVRVGPWWGLLLTLVVGGLIVTGMLQTFDEIWEWVRDSGGVVRLDLATHAAAVESRTPWLTAVLTVVTHASGKIGMPILAAAIAITLSTAARSWRPTVLIVIVGLGSLLLTSTMKDAAGRERPPHADALPPLETSPSFPSGHTLNATAVLAIVAYCAVLQFDRLTTKAIAVAGCVVFVGAVGASRVYLGHHWLTDVAGAFALGCAWATVVVVGHQVFSVVRQRGRDRAAGRVRDVEIEG